MQSDRTLAIMQPYFLPYLGYFQLMAKADAFVFYDDVNFINRGWVNRNRINIGGTAHTITIPLQHASQNKLICEIVISNDSIWRKKIIRSIQQTYAKASQFHRIFPLIESIVNHPTENLADYLRHSLVTLRDHFGLATDLVDSSRNYFNKEMKAQTRIIDICLQEKANKYINPAGGVALYDRSAFEAHGLKLAFLNPTLHSYPTGDTPFLPGLSIIDVLMHNDPEALTAHLHAGILS